LYCPRLSLLFERQAQDAAGDKGNSNPLAQGVVFTKKSECENGDEHEAEFIYCSDIRCIADLKSPKIADL